MAVAARAFELEAPISISPTQEVYGKSLRNLRVMGHLALKDMVETPEYSGALQERWTDFYTAVGENLVTDPDYTEVLHFDLLESREIHDGHVVDKTGKLKMVDLVKTGWQSSLAAAKNEPEMIIQAERDEGDVQIAHIVDNLEVGESYTVVSVEPKDQLKHKPKFWCDVMNYREGVAVVQEYYRKSEHELLAGNYSVKHSSLEALRAIFSEHGVDVPEGESPNRWSRYGIRKTMTEIEAQNFGPELVLQHARETRQTAKTHSVTKLIAENSNTVEEYFTTYIVPLSDALASRQNNETMQSFAQSLLQQGITMNTNKLRSLLRVANSNKFTEEDAFVMEEMTRYALIEQLRKLIPGLNNNQPVTHTEIVYVAQPIRITPMQTSSIDLYALNARASRNVASGLKAGRSYGGCSGAGNTIENDFDEFSEGADSQNIFSGTDKKNINDNEDKNKWVWKNGICRVEKCPTRPGKTKIGPCKVCHTCQNWFDRGRDPAKLYAGLKSIINESVTIKKSESRKQTTFKKKVKNIDE